MVASSVYQKVGHECESPQHAFESGELYGVFTTACVAIRLQARYEREHFIELEYSSISFL